MRRTAWLFLAVLNAASANDRGELAGLIQDTSGGALPVTIVTVMDQDSGIRRAGRTDGEGAYAIPGLPAGEYRVTVRRPGFQTIVRWNVKVEAGQEARLDFVMLVGSMQEVIIIQGGPSPINTTDGSLGTVVGRGPIESLPVSGRGVISLVELSPGVVATPAATGEAGQFSTNGLRANTNYFTVDGVSANTSVTGAGLPAQFAGAALPAMTAFGSTENLASMDALDEVHILSSSFAPQFGRLPGAQVALTTRSGSDQYHGSASWALRNEALNANDAFAQGNGLGRAPLRLNQWTANAGGPVRANRTFFFASYEGLRLEQPYAYPLTTPSLAARAAAPPGLQPILDAFPAPDSLLPGGLLGERIAQFTRPSRLDAGSVRVDHALTAKITLFGRYNWAPSYTESGFTQIEHFRLRTSSFTLGVTAMPSPAVGNDLRMNIWNTSAASEWSLNPASGGTPLDLSAVLPASAATTPNFYGLAIGGVGALYSGVTAGSRQGQWNLVDTLAVTRGKHAVRLGLDYQRLTPARAGASRSVTETWPSLPDVLAGTAANVTTTSADQASALVETLSIFAQDTWSVSHRLTFTYGLRWEITPPPAIREPAAAAASGAAAAAPGALPFPVAPLDQALWQTRYRQIAPRIGAAYRLGDRSVLRAGWGIFYDVGFSNALDPINAFPFNRWQFSTGGSASQIGPAYGLRTAPDLQLPYAAEWNFAFEHMFGLRDVVSASYVGSEGHRLLRYEGILQTGTRLAEAAAATNHGRSNYQGLEFQYRRQLAKGIQGTAAYTWAHAIDNGSFDSGLYLAPQQLGPASDRGPAAFDVRHSLAAGFTYAAPQKWEFSAMLRARTGFPIDVQTLQNFLGLGFDDVTRPNLVPGVPIWLASRGLGGRRLNPAAFSTPAGIQGNLGRDSIAGFGMSQLDLAAQRRFPLSDRFELQLRAEAYNAFNHPNSADPVRFLDSPYFGTATSMLNLMLGSGTARSGLAPAFQPGGPRSLQLSVRLQF
jgi:hypothetical protein